MTAGALAHLRLPAEQSRGRRYPEPLHPYRTAFQRDRDRIIHTRAFRRLENKTQVFPQGLSDHFRNRLTHTLEVAQLARTVSLALGLDEDLTEALALAHDLGHPPFGHAGEEELDRQMRRFGLRFDHNQHALRIVDVLEQRYAAFPGLNLSFEVREGILKHSRDLEPGVDPEEFLPALRPPVEAQLIDWADEIAYNTADLDDADSADMVDHDLLFASIPALREEWETAETMYPAAARRVLFHEMLRRVINRLVSGLIQGTASAARPFASVEEVRHHGRRVAGLEPESASINRALKEFLHRYVYKTPGLQQERADSVRRIGELFDFLMAEPDQLPPASRQALEDVGLARVVCDYIAGMTDGYLQRIHALHFGG